MAPEVTHELWKPIEGGQVKSGSNSLNLHQIDFGKNCRAICTSSSPSQLLGAAAPRNQKRTSSLNMSVTFVDQKIYVVADRVLDMAM